MYTQFAHDASCMEAVFVELPAFERNRPAYLDDEAFVALQREMMKYPQAGDEIQGAGGLRKLRFRDKRCGKGKRSGLRVIYYWWSAGRQFWLFTLYDKDEADDLTPHQRKALKAMVKREVAARSEL